jgi:hypothetical protein
MNSVMHLLLAKKENTVSPSIGEFGIATVPGDEGKADPSSIGGLVAFF